MVEPNYIYCPFDGEKLVIESRHGSDYQVCSKCKRTLYTNQQLTASAVIVREGKLLVAIRALEPFKGAYDLPGGFVEPTETAREAILREVSEELHVLGSVVKPFEVLGPDPYPFEGINHQNADMLYQVDIGQAEPRPDDDVSGIKWIPIEELSESDFAFPSHKQFIAGLKTGEYVLS